MSCPKDKLELLHDGELPPAERDAVRAHLALCAGCRAEVDALGRLDALLARAPATPQPRWEGYVPRVSSRVRGRAWRGVAAAAAAILVGFTAWNVWDQFNPAPKRPAAAARVPAEVQLQKWAQAQVDAALLMVVRALGDPKPEVQLAAARILSGFRDARVRDLLVEYAKRQPPVSNGETWTLDSPDTRSVAVAMREAERSGDADRLINVIGRGPLDPDIREAVSRWAQSLLASKNPRLRDLGLAIVRELDVEFPWIAVIELVGETPKAVEALREKTGRDFGADKKAWRRYLEEM